MQVASCFKLGARCVVLAHTQLDVNRRVRHLLGVSKASFATAEEVQAVTGMQVGGVTLGVVTIPARQPIVRAQELRAAITSASSLELCRVAVREGLLGKRMAGAASLRTRGNKP